MDIADIDIDFPTAFDPRSIFPQAVPASLIRDGDIMKHPCGYYLQSIPIDQVTNIAAIPYEEAEVLGYTKIDFLHLSVLDNFKTKRAIRALSSTEPNWKLLTDPENIAKLIHIHGHADLVIQVTPTSVAELADCLALIRPTKRQLLSQYLANREKTRPLLYKQTTDDKSAFRRSHAIAYALTIVLQMHLIELGKL